MPLFYFWLLFLAIALCSAFFTIPTVAAVQICSADAMVLQIRVIATPANIVIPLQNPSLKVDWDNGDEQNITADTNFITGGYTTTGQKTICLEPLSSMNSLFDFGNASLLGMTLTNIEFVGCDSFGNLGIKRLSASFAYLNTTNFYVPGTLPAGLVGLHSTFRESRLFNCANVSAWDVSAVTTMFGTFWGTNFNYPLNWDVSNVISMNSMFAHTPQFNQPIESWTTTYVSDTSYMFYNASVFNQPLNSWDVVNVRFMVSMFGYTVFNQPLDGWQTASLETITSIFFKNPVFNQPIESWNVAKVVNASSAFYGAVSFNQPLNAWDTSSIVRMGSMFAYATSFNQAIDSWNTSQVTDLTSTFQSANAFNISLVGWDTSSVTSMYATFYNATSFNGDISTWDTSKGTIRFCHRCFLLSVCFNATPLYFRFSHEYVRNFYVCARIQQASGVLGCIAMS
jgi:surface protein